MSKRLILILTLAFVLGISYSAYAEVQNVKVSGDLTVSGVARNSLTLKDNETVADYGETITAILSQVRLRVDADLTDNVSTTVRLINERAWGDEADADDGVLSTANRTSRSNNTDISLDLAYVTLKEFLYSPLTLSIGRQELRYGNALIIGDRDSNNYADGHLTTARYLPNSLDDLSLRKAFDAIKATLDYDPLVIDLVYAKIDENQVQRYDDVDLAGVNAAYQVNKDLNTEAYFWQRTRGVGMASTTTPVPSKAEKLRTVGAKGMYTGIENLILSLESAFQFGNNVTILYTDQAGGAPANRKVTAYAIQGGGMYMMPDVRYTPSVLVAYTYLSGAKYLSVSDNYHGWDPMFEDQATGTIYNKLAAQSNSQSINIDASIKPMEDVTATLKYMHVRLLNPYTAVGQPTTLTGITGDPTYTMRADKKHFGDEVDLVLTYDYTEDVQFGLNAGAFIPGSAFESANDKTATQVIGSMKVTF